MSKRIFAAVAIPALIAAGVILLVATRPATLYPTAATPPTSSSVSSSVQALTTPLAPTENVMVSSTVDTSNWKTYRNEKYGIEIKYPPLYSFERNEDTQKLPTFGRQRVKDY